jgi:cell division protein FtsI (penicillin-binding protein 3)
LFFVLTLAFSFMAIRLFTLQILQSKAYAKIAAQQRERVITFPARRGAIFDRNGTPLAISVDLPTIYTDPVTVKDPVATAEALAPVLERDPAELAEKLAGTWEGSRFEYLARQVTPKVARKVKRLALPGVYFRTEPKRYYPGDKLASQVIGFTNVDGQGIAGVELQYDEILRGRPGQMTLEQDPSGRALPQAQFSETTPTRGHSLFLTIDKQLQYFTELTLAQAVDQYKAINGTAVVMRPSTGEILAMATAPDFDPNHPADSPDVNLRNMAVTDMYEPGSVFKLVTAAGALESKAVTPRTVFDVPPTLAVADRVIHDAESHGALSMSVRDIIVHSSNIGTVKIGMTLGQDRLDAHMREFGFGAKTGLDFPGESPGIVIDKEDWSGSSIGTIPIGQGVATTPLQLTAAFASIANGGTWVEPKLLHSTLDDEGKAHRSPAPAAHRVVSRKTARQMTDILEGVVAEGTGLEAAIPGYRVAGKTGTAQKVLPTGGYGGGYIASFAGFAPASRPAVVVLVKLDRPTPIWGGVTAAPTFRKITEFALRELGVPPTGNAQKAAEEIESSETEPVPAHGF